MCNYCATTTSKEVLPYLVEGQKRHTKDQNLQFGDDVVMICESSKVKAMYKMSVIDDVTTNRSGVVLAATVRYATLRMRRTHGDMTLSPLSV